MKRFFLVLLLMIPALLISANVGYGKLHIFFLDIGQGDATLIVGPDGSSCIIDGGPSDDTAPFVDAMDYAINNGLSDDTLDYVVVTHFHADHIKGLDEFHALYPGGLIAAYDRGGTYSTIAFDEYDAYFGTAGLNKRQNGTAFSLGEATMTYLGRGGSGSSSDENNNGIVYRLDFGEFQCFFGGDLEKSYEPPKGQIAGDVDLYQVNHHGSYNASQTSFLDYIKPEAHVFSYGIGNSYGHPSSEAIERLDNIGSIRYDTPYDYFNGHLFTYCITDGQGYFSINGEEYSLPGWVPTAEPVEKWSQSPNHENGYDVESWIYNLDEEVVADDWICTSGLPITQIRWWGSYPGWEEDTSTSVTAPLARPAAFVIKWYEYVPGTPHGIPGDLLSQDYCTSFTEQWHTAVPLWNKPGKWEHEFVYDCDLQTSMPQVADTNYFLTIQALYTEPHTYKWGWANSTSEWNDGALVSTDTLTWTELTWPMGHELEGRSMDMSFELRSPIPDYDTDGIPDALEYLLPPIGRSNKYLPDSDGDGLTDGQEDANENGSHDPGETCTRNPDTDGDGLYDGVEVLLLNTDPLDMNDPVSYTDNDADGLPASIDPDDSTPDTDGDGFTDRYELLHGSDGNLEGDMPPLGDLDGDGSLTQDDCDIARKLCLGIYEWEDYNVGNMDVNCDGRLTNMDWLILRRHLIPASGFNLLPRE